MISRGLKYLIKSNSYISCKVNNINEVINKLNIQSIDLLRLILREQSMIS